MILQAASSLPTIPQRIVSLVPSITELLFYIGAGENTVGATKFCVHPRALHLTKTIIGGTKNINLGKIKALEPDLIIANKEENVKEQVEELAKEYPVWLTDVGDFDTALQMIDDIGKLTGKNTPATELINEIQQAFTTIRKPSHPINTAYLIWQNPYMSVGGDTYIHDMLNHCGLKNIFGEEKRYPVVTVDDLINRKCELLLLSTEPYPFKQKHIDALQLQLPQTKIVLADGEMFSWYGSRLLYAADYFNQLLLSIIK